MGKERGLYIEDMAWRKMRELGWGVVGGWRLDAYEGIDKALRSIDRRPLGVWLNMQLSFRIHDEAKLESFQRNRKRSRGPAAWLYVAFTDNGANTWPLVNGLVAAVRANFGQSDPNRRWEYRVLIREDGSWSWNDPLLTVRALRRRRVVGLYNNGDRRRGRIIEANGSAFVLQEEGTEGPDGRRLAYYSSLESTPYGELGTGDWLRYLPEDRRINGMQLVEYVVAEKNAPARFREQMAAAG